MKEVQTLQFWQRHKGGNNDCNLCYQYHHYYYLLLESAAPLYNFDYLYGCHGGQKNYGQFVRHFPLLHLLARGSINY